MYKSIIIPIITALLFISCKKKQDPFEIGKQHIGSLTDSTQIKELKSIYPNDSIVNFMGIDDIEIFEKGGKQLLILTPRSSMDSTSVIENVHVIDSRYKTDKNISTLSTFKNILDTYKISKIDNLINSIVVNVNDINASFVIDKKELPANLRFDRQFKFEATHIPDNAKIKYFFINWTKT